MKLFGFLQIFFERQGPEKAKFLFLLSLVDISRKTKVLKAYIMFKRSYNLFFCHSYVININNICWSVVYNEEQPATNKHAPIK